MIKVSKINGFVWLKVFNDTGLLYSDGNFQSISEAMEIATYYLNQLNRRNKNEERRIGFDRVRFQAYANGH